TKIAQKPHGFVERSASMVLRPRPIVAAPVETACQQPHAISAANTAANSLTSICLPFRLTPELSGGAAVRLDEELDGCDAACSGDDVGAQRAQSLSNRLPQNCQLPKLRLATTLREMLRRRRTTSQREAGRNTRYDKPTRAAD